MAMTEDTFVSIVRILCHLTNKSNQNAVIIDYVMFQSGAMQRVMEC